MVDSEEKRPESTPAFYSLGSFDVHERTGIVLKFLLAGDRAEIEIFAVILAVAGCVVLVNFHSADWIDRHGVSSSGIRMKGVRKALSHNFCAPRVRVVVSL